VTEGIESPRSSSDEPDIGSLQAGLRMATPPDPAALASERMALAALEGKSLGERVRGYWKLIGPGYMQSAMTLGGGTATSALFAGALFGYDLLWVAPVAMLLGVLMLSVIAHQTLSTGMRPFAAMCRYAGKPIAWGWALGALLASIIWHFPQYSLASACLVDMGEVVGVEGLSPSLMGFVVLAWALGLSYLYGGSPRLVRAYEQVLKFTVWGIILAFGAVVLKTGVEDFGALAAGFVPGSFGEESNGMAAFTLILAGLSAAVGINMVFLYPYSLLARGWGREHRGLARFDLWSGMFIPYILAASLITIAAANTLHIDPSYDGTKLAPVDFSHSLAQVVGPTLGRVVFNIGVLAMALSTITLHMLCTGFVCTEIFGLEVGGKGYRLATLLPVPGVLGSVYWSDIAVYLAVPTSIFCGLFLPLAYFGFIRLQMRRDYLGDDRPSGTSGRLLLAGMIVTTLFLTGMLAKGVYEKVPGYLEQLFGS